MKKYLILFFLALSISGMRANVALPRAWVSEVFVDSTGNWFVEMGFYEYDIQDIDSIYLITSSGSSLITSYDILPVNGWSDFDSLAVITSENVAGSVTINPGCDFVKLESYCWGNSDFDYVAFGNYPGSYLDCILPGESVINIGYQEFCIDNSPSIGAGNDDAGYGGAFSGVAYDLSGNPITVGIIKMIGNFYLSINPDEQGSFLEGINTRRYTCDTIEHILPPWPNTITRYTIEPVDFCQRPDSSAHVQDIITTSLIMGIEEDIIEAGNVVTIAPNPFSDKVVFYFKQRNSDPGEMDFSIYSLDGRRIHGIALSPDQNRYEWSPQNSISSGTYIYRLEKDNTIVKTGKFVRY